MTRHLESQVPGPALGTAYGDRAPAAIVERNAKDAALRRGREQADRLHFLVYGHDEHHSRVHVDGQVGCLCDEPCSRNYDPLPYPEAALTNENDYVGTGIGLLYGLGGEQHAWQLAGWNVRRPT